MAHGPPRSELVFTHHNYIRAAALADALTVPIFTHPTYVRAAAVAASGNQLQWLLLATTQQVIAIALLPLKATALLLCER